MSNDLKPTIAEYLHKWRNGDDGLYKYLDKDENGKERWYVLIHIHKTNVVSIIFMQSLEMRRTGPQYKIVTFQFDSEGNVRVHIPNPTASIEETIRIHLDGIYTNIISTLSEETQLFYERCIPEFYKINGIQ